MNILVEIGHPAHVHFFKNPISLWRKQNHRVFIVTRDKEITHQLLNELRLEYQVLSKQKQNMAMQFIELIWRWIQVMTMIFRHKIDLAISISGISTAFPAKVCGIKSITLTDTEDANLSNRIAFPFSDIILTPSTFRKKGLNPRIKSYESFHEIAYLHPNWFKSDSGALIRNQLNPAKPYIFVRLVKWKALHDLGEQGLTDADLAKLIEKIKFHGFECVISSERTLPEAFASYAFKGRLTDIFNVLAFSHGFIGESPTMAVESALLGRAAILINPRFPTLGNMLELENKYGILKNFLSFKAVEPLLDQYLSQNKSGTSLNLHGLENLWQDKIDISTWLADYSLKFAKGGA